MFADFQRPSNGWLCFLSVVWVLGGVFFVVSFTLAGKWIAAVMIGVFVLAALGLWFQSAIAAWVIIALAVVGCIYALLSIGKMPTLRVIWRICFAIWSVSLLIEYLKEQKQR